jgi:asparagine synthase (glutamine-hydrolysing)
MYKSNLLKKFYQGNLEHKVATLNELVKTEHLGDFYHAFLSNQACLELDSLLLEPTREKKARLINEDMSGLMLKDIRHYLPDDLLVKMDRATMYNSIEGREPFLDHRLVEMACSMPLNIKYNDGQSKWILKEILSEYVPREYFIRPKKGFSIPIFKWFSEHMDHLFEVYLTLEKINATGIFNVKEVEQELRKYRWNKRNGKESNIEKMWRLLSFMLWWEKWHLSN